MSLIRCTVETTRSTHYATQIPWEKISIPVVLYVKRIGGTIYTTQHKGNTQLLVEMLKR